MRQWSITLYGPSGVLNTVDTGEAQFVIGTEAASDVFTVEGEGVSARHAWVWIGEEGLQAEDLGGGTCVNGHSITVRVRVEYPASVQVGELTLVVEPKAVVVPEVTPVSRASRSMDITMPQISPKRSVAAVRAEPESLMAANEALLQGKYTLVREIARGGMGQIYFGEDPQLKRHVAVKVSSVSEGGEDPRFSKEAEVLAQLAHPNIVPIHNIGVDAQGRPFYSMKLVKGRTLQAALNLIRDGDPVAIKDYPRTTLLTIFRKVCDAMMFAHSKGILHRDLKPENIMVGEYGEVLVMDWGLAKVLGEQETEGAANSWINATSDYGMTLEGEVMGTPQYMSPEQAEGMVAELDQRSDIYSLGGILYAILTLRPPIEGTTLDEVLTKVRNGSISAMVTRRGGKAVVTVNAPSAMGAEIPEALQAVTLKAMSKDRGKRYESVESFAADIERYQNGFATQAEDAGSWKRIKLWVGRNKVLAGSAAVLVFVVGGFTGRVVQKGREASEALRSLRGTAPTFAVRAQDALRDGQFEEALKAATFAVKLEPENCAYHALRGNILQLLIRWPEALEAYHAAVRSGAEGQVNENLDLTADLIARSKSEGEAKAKVALFEALNLQGRQYEAMELGKGLGDFWKERKKDPSALPKLRKNLESKLLPVPGTDVLMCKTEMTVGEWKLYLRAEGLTDWNQPEPDQYMQTEEHPVVKISWEAAKAFCEWLSAKSGEEWRLPTNAEWDAAVGTSTYPWGEYFPPHWDDGNYAILESGKDDPNHVGLDGIFGTAPVATFKPNALGFYDLGGNASEWMWDGFHEKTGYHLLRGASWFQGGAVSRSSSRLRPAPIGKYVHDGFRLVRRPTP